ncbi:Type I restriction modification DNA specificity domain [Pasteurella dagmatis]|nr:Type I restriction modification DNA specificity domain [Pasteurella dagmatis]
MKDIALVNPKKENLPDDLDISFLPMSLVSEYGQVIGFETRKVYKVKKGYTAFKNKDIIFAKITPCFENGKAALLNDLENGYGFGSTEFHVIRSQNNCNPNFLFSYLYSDTLLIKGKKSMTGSAGQQRVPAQFFENYIIALPPPEEQQAIANCLSSLDSLISEQNQQICRLKTHKKGLMQQLFPTLQ